MPLSSSPPLLAFVSATPHRSCPSNSCYSETGSALFDAKATADKDNLATIGRNNITYPCSAANLLTPKVVGGKILPLYIFEDSSIHVHHDEIDLLADYAAAYARTGNVFITAAVLACIFGTLGVSMLLLCLCFEQVSFLDYACMRVSLAHCSNSSSAALTRAETYLPGRDRLPAREARGRSGVS